MGLSDLELETLMTHAKSRSRSKPQKQTKHIIQKIFLRLIASKATFLATTNWLNVIFIIIIPTIGFWKARSVPLHTPTALWTVVYYFCTGFGISAGYHRLWSHSSYTASRPLKLFLALYGRGAREFIWAHMGWMIKKQDPETIRRVSISNRIKIRLWTYISHCIAGLGWGDWKGGLIYAGFVRLFVVQQLTFCINSIAHWIREQTYDNTRTPRNNTFAALITLGEGWHNFHHEFPSDYHCAVQWYQSLGLAGNLQRLHSNEIEKGLKQGKRALTVIAGVVHDVTEFIEHHPGGPIMIRGGIGKNATAMFNGGVYGRSRNWVLDEHRGAVG
ncbi:uncharacterized protein BP01DRAFT_378015 [Aspergillus saccharolyticus JOP 1030-1]|uniref:Cytochrome b5 heme-binding domain-containing protein n=1 Tax=Aspergillus saccharolyticus JOP 1030-1 TaxID=1450539 RepID=A0A318YZ28_9EURO|nr:hypothetical protein BP01DRAFT_378015 [Aspergillus saccharolyticus JOP 1030-1]PYH40261.1 hypothetical protein BP01DRAFT_378015 [Aspergillus saccharolyticus JOP 1030-1]